MQLIFCNIANILAKLFKIIFFLEVVVVVVMVVEMEADRGRINFKTLFIFHLSRDILRSLS